MNNVVLEVKNLFKSFNGKRVHRGVGLTLKKGMTLGVLGNSGTGKSVLLRSIIGLETIDDGEIYFEGQRIDLLNETEMLKIRTRLSYAFQSGALFDSLSVFENIAYPLFEHTQLSEKEITIKVHHMLDLVNMKGSDTLMPSDLSGGMQKRIGLARSMVLDPAIVLYDEPTAGLDPSNVENVIEIMHRVRLQGISGIFVTHDIPAALKICDHFIILQDGQTAFSGTKEEFLFSNNEFVKKFHSH